LILQQDRKCPQIEHFWDVYSGFIPVSFRHIFAADLQLLVHICCVSRITCFYSLSLYLTDNTVLTVTLSHQVILQLHLILHREHSLSQLLFWYGLV